MTDELEENDEFDVELDFIRSPEEFNAKLSCYFFCTEDGILPIQEGGQANSTFDINDLVRYAMMHPFSW